MFDMASSASGDSVFLTLRVNPVTVRYPIRATSLATVSYQPNDRRSRMGLHFRLKYLPMRDHYTDFSREYIADLCPMTAAFGYRFADSARRLRLDGR